MFGANVCFKMHQFKECVEFCDKALGLNSEFKKAQDLKGTASKQGSVKPHVSKPGGPITNEVTLL